ncbi:hypothetical protein V6U90_22795 [Micromonospora sp. CPCC 206060]|uniref:hypothetical protein n=1 Tax=Micromonospora sp. CPCC 206060 TaxID=3122406 RepID=UPI002FF1B024
MLDRLDSRLLRLPDPATIRRWTAGAMAARGHPQPGDPAGDRAGTGHVTGGCRCGHRAAGGVRVPHAAPPPPAGNRPSRCWSSAADRSD